MFGILTAGLAAFLPLSELAKLVNIGTLFAFLMVNVGVIILCRTGVAIYFAYGRRHSLLRKGEVAKPVAGPG